MLTNFWRFSHLLLALISGVFLFIATVTGIILFTEPITDAVQSPSQIAGADTLTLAEVVPALKENYIEVFSLATDRQHAVIIDAIGFDEAPTGTFFIQPLTGEKIAEIQPKKPIYSWATNLHRSLFMHNTGRILVGITSFFLFLMACTGIALVLKKTNGFKKLFSKFKKQKGSGYYHTVLGRIAFIFVAILSLSGVFMSLNTQFPAKNSEIINHSPEKNQHIPLSDFEVFNTTHLRDIKILHFPFSDDESDYFELELTDKTLQVNQYTGEIVATQNQTVLQQVYSLSEVLHTGRGQVIWSIFLGLTSLAILYFIYSGTKITWKRLSSKAHNTITLKEAEIILLVGSENGATKSFASLLLKSLLKAKHKVYLDDLNHYQLYKNAKHLIILTSTYGDGEPPYNAKYFLQKAKKIKQRKSLKTFIIGFGSLSYPNYCKYALDIHRSLAENSSFILDKDPVLIHGQSYSSYKSALENWKEQNGIKFELPHELETKKRPTHSFKIIDKKELEEHDSLTFTLILEAQEKTAFQAGDLLAIIPPEEEVARYYSIGKLDHNRIFLSIKKHTFGKCSSYLWEQEIGNLIEAKVKRNPTFHFPKKRDALLIGNGTGIAPFIGMNSSKGEYSLIRLLGGRTPQSFTLYETHIPFEEAKNCRNYYAYSKLEQSERYVQDLLIKHASLVAQILNNNGTIMICGSVKMRDGVLQEIKSIITRERIGLLSEFIENDQILMDCY